MIFNVRLSRACPNKMLSQFSTLYILARNKPIAPVMTDISQSTLAYRRLFSLGLLKNDSKNLSGKNEIKCLAVTYPLMFVNIVLSKEFWGRNQKEHNRDL